MTEKEHLDIQIQQDWMIRQTKKEQRAAYNQKTEDTLINIGEIASGDMQKCSMLLAAIYTELRRQGRE